MKKAADKILHNSIWYSIELGLEIVIFFGTSVAVARYLGPEKLGHFSYINLFIAVLTRTGGAGLSNATRKYMVEELAKDRPGGARAVYNLAHRYQLISSCAMAALGVAAVFLFGQPVDRWMSIIMIVSIVPGLMSLVPAEANNAFQDVSKNTISAFGYLSVYVVVIVLTIHFKWDLVGVASATLLGRTVELFLRTIPLNRMLRVIPLDTLDGEMMGRIRRFCAQSLGIQLLTTVVFDRSEIFFLGHFSTYEQIGLYSVSFGLTLNLLTASKVFGGGSASTLMLEAGRDPQRVRSIVDNIVRYLLLIMFPVCFGATAIILPAVQLVYGHRYLAAVPIMVVAILLVIFRAFQWIPDILLRTADQQNLTILWYGVTAVVNIVLDYFLIKRYGAVGAAWGNGLAQAFSVFVAWKQAQRFYQFGLPLSPAIRMALASAMIAGEAYFISHRLHGVAGLIIAVVVAAVSYFVLLRAFGCLYPADRERLAPIGNKLPGPARRAYLAAITFATASAS